MPASGRAGRGTPRSPSQAPPGKGSRARAPSPASGAARWWTISGSCRHGRRKRAKTGMSMSARVAMEAEDTMKLGRVIGRVVCTQKMECFDGLKLLLVQPVDEKGNDAGPALVAFDVARAGEGDLVMYEAGKEAAQANPNGWFNPGDAAIIGIVDAVDGGARSTGDAKRAHRGGKSPGARK